MKKNISGIELKFLVEEFQSLMGAKIAKIFQPEKREIYIQFHVSGEGKKILRIVPPDFIYISDYKPESPQNPLGFCQSLRKWLNMTRIKEIRQNKLERVLEIILEGKETDYRLIIELFSKGNIILCKDDYTIISAMERQEWKDRTITRGQKYIFPKGGIDAGEIEFEGFKDMLQKTKKESLAAFLAIELGLGGIYAEEVCSISDIDKASIKLNESKAKKLFEAIKDILNRKIEPKIIYSKEDNEKVIDIAPFSLQQYEDHKTEPAESFNNALDKALTDKIFDIKEAEDPAKKEKERVQKILDMQQENISKMKQEMEESQNLGEWIYEHYKELEGLLSSLSKDVKGLSKEDLIEKYKIKEINTKAKTASFEIKDN